MASDESSNATIVVPGHYGIVGTIYITVPSIMLVIYTVFNVVLGTDCQFRHLQVYRIMLYIGILDCIQLCCHIFGGVATLWEGINIKAPYLCKVIGGTLNSAWVGLFPISLFNAVHRLHIVRSRTSTVDKFSSIMKAALCCCFLYCLAFWICLLTGAEVTYNRESVSWSYGRDSWSKFMSELEFFVSIVCIALTFIVYIVIVVSIYKTSKFINVIKRNERQLLIQATIVFLILSSLLFSWHFYQLILPETYWTYFSINLYWICYCCLNPVLSVVFSKTIRDAYFSFIGLHSKKQLHAMSVTPRRAN